MTWPLPLIAAWLVVAVLGVLAALDGSWIAVPVALAMFVAAYLFARDWWEAR